MNEPWEYKELQIQILYFYHHGYSGEDIFLHLLCYFKRDEIADYYEVAFSKGQSRVRLYGIVLKNQENPTFYFPTKKS